MEAMLDTCLSEERVTLTDVLVVSAVGLILGTDAWLVSRGLPSFSERHGVYLTVRWRRWALTAAWAALLLHLYGTVLPFPRWMRVLDPFGAAARTIEQARRTKEISWQQAHA